MNNMIFRDSYVDRSPFTPAPVGPGDWQRPPRPRAAWSRRVARRLDYRARLSEVRAFPGHRRPARPADAARTLVNGFLDGDAGSGRSAGTGRAERR